MIFDVLIFRIDGRLHLRHLFLEFAKFWIPAAKFRAELSELAAKVRFLGAKHLQGRRRRQRSNELRVRWSGQPVTSLLNNSVRLGLSKLLIQLLQTVGNNIV